MDYSFLIGATEDFAVDYCKNNSIEFSILYTNDKKTIGNDKIVIAVRATLDKLVLIVGRFLLKVLED